MIDSCDVLVDDGTFVKISRGIVCRGANQFDSTYVRLVIGLAACKCWQKGVMDIDDRRPTLFNKVIGKHLHVARHDDELGNVLLHDLERACFPPQVCCLCLQECGRRASRSVWHPLLALRDWKQCR